MKLKSLLVAVGAFLAVGTASRYASAEYVCSVSYRPASNTSTGSDGYVYYSTYSGPDCTGTFTSSLYLCSGGSTSSACASSTTYRYERQGLLALYHALTDALIYNTYVYPGQTTCNGGTAGCGSYVTIYAD